MTKPVFHRPRGKASPCGHADLAGFMAWATELVLKDKAKAVRVQTADFTASWAVKPAKKRAVRK